MQANKLPGNNILTKISDRGLQPELKIQHVRLISQLIWLRWITLMKNANVCFNAIDLYKRVNIQIDFKKKKKNQCGLLPIHQHTVM